jgi:hypothetical protein
MVPSVRQLLPYDSMTTALTDGIESVLLDNSADLRARQIDLSYKDVVVSPQGDFGG